MTEYEYDPLRRITQMVIQLHQTVERTATGSDVTIAFHVMSQLDTINDQFADVLATVHVSKLIDDNTS